MKKLIYGIQNIISRPELNRINLPDEIQTIVQNSTNDFLEAVLDWIKTGLTKFLNALTSIPTIFFYIVICILSLYFICTDKIYMLDWLDHHLPEIWVKHLIKHIREIAKVLGNYLKAEAILVIISFIICLIGLYSFKLLGLNVKYPLMTAIGIGFVDALPIFGSGTVMLPWAFFIACEGNYVLSVSILGLWIIMAAVRQFIEPKIVSGKIGIHPIFTLISMYTGFKLIGVIGMLIGPIILIILKNIFSNLLDKGIMKSIFDRE